MKGIVSILELMITGIILVLAFIHFFPQYSIKTNWDSVLLDLQVKDVLTTIDRSDKTLEYAVSDDSGAFDNFMNTIYNIDYSNQTMVFMKEIQGTCQEFQGQTFKNSKSRYFAKSQKETIVDVFSDGDTFCIYSFTLILGYPY